MTPPSSLLQAVHLASRKLASSGNFDQLLKEVLVICVESVGARGGTIYLHDPATSQLKFQHVLPEEMASRLPPAIADNYGLVGKAFQTRESVLSQFEAGIGNEEEKKTGEVVRTMVTVPLMMEGEDPIGVVQLLNKVNEQQFDEDDAKVLDIVSAISTMAYLNSRLTEESTRASNLLGMGKVAHDIKNLAFALEANVSFSDQTLAGLKEFAGGDQAPVGLLSYVDSIDVMFEELMLSIDRIKRYSMLISDLSAGKQLNPIMKLAPLAMTIELAAAYLESEGRSSRTALRYDIQTDAPPLLHDEMFLFRIVQNLVSNAIKATREVMSDDARAQADEDEMLGEVVVRYRFYDGAHWVEIQDQGPGMDEETASRILQGTARSLWAKNSGSGWGTKIVLELAATHDALVSIDSEIGRGSTFRVKFPHREA